MVGVAAEAKQDAKGALAPMQETELLVAEIETRLRNSILRVLRPTLDQISGTEKRMGDVAAKVNSHDKLLNGAETLRAEVRQIKSYADVIAEDLATHKKAATQVEQDTAGKIGELGHKLAETDRNVDAVQGAVGKLTREGSRVWEECERMQNQHNEDVAKLSNTLASTTKRLDKSLDEVLEFVRELQKQRVEMLDDLFGDEGALARIRNDVTQLQLDVSSVAEMGNEIQRMTGIVDKISDKCDRCWKTCEDERNFNAQTRKEIQVSQEEAEKKFKTQSNLLLAHHGTMLKAIRYDYDSEIDGLRQLQAEILSFRGDIDARLSNLAEGAATEARRVDAVWKELVTDMRTCTTKRAEDRSKFETDMSVLRNELTLSKESWQRQSGAMHYLSRVLALLLEGEQVVSAISVQDYADRSAECWLGVAEHARPPHKPVMAEDLIDQSRLKQETFANYNDKGLVQIDYRRGFATDSYKPGQVLFKGKTYERRDLILMHHKLLQQVRAALERGPLEARLEAFSNIIADSDFRITAQKSARGTPATSNVAASPRKWRKAEKVGTPAGDDPRTPLRSLVGSCYGTPAKANGCAGDLDAHAAVANPAAAGRDPWEESRGGDAGAGTSAKRASRGRVVEQRQSSKGQRPASNDQPQARGSRGFQVDADESAHVRLPAIGARGSLSAR
eukprot:TRINITY_DN28077_c0_g3_i1.p1 TRINITY_DN28077_c0_g3~~TRINITY_DN28077_c0_g3_i1.p1  ORF type:complete len:692 (+),score=133.82 TRINITY_DN28077_c0_g3_i1:52-2076(+)